MCSCGSRKAQPLEKPHIILLLIDTLRPDHMSCYGYARKTTPVIDSLAGKGLIFENAIAPSSWTVPCTATILTGLQPQRHGCVQGILHDKQVLRQHQLHPGLATLAEKLLEAGYDTFGYSANSHITQAMGFGQGFNVFRQIKFMNAEVLETLLHEDISSIRRSDHVGRPYFIYMHFVDPHWPYQHRPKAIKRLGINDRTKAMQDVRVMQGDPMLHYPPGYFRENEQYLNALKDLYDGEVNAVDEVIGRILAELPRSDQAMIAVVSDHGEAFSEHDTMLHGYDLYRETVRVPLILRPPVNKKKAAQSRRIGKRAMLIDVMPTLLTFAEANTDFLPGIDLMKDFDPERETPLQLSRGPIRWHGAVVGHLKGIVHEAVGKKMLFDTKEDPLEKNDLFAGPGYSDELAAAMEKAAAINPQLVPRMITNEDIGDLDKLRSLGYLTGGSKPKNTPTPTPTPEPEKDPWIITMGLCPKIFKIDEKCGDGPEELRDYCVEEKLNALKKKRCAGIGSFNIRKKCDNLRLETALRMCSE